MVTFRERVTKGSFRWIIDRWINKIIEPLLLNRIFLKDKPYKTVTDYFIYNSNIAKNAPDILGIRDSKKIIKFTEFDKDK